MLTTQTELIVRYAETDQMGIVHHSNYPVWFEAGRTDFVKALGISYSEIEEKGIMLPLMELKCHFKGYSKYEDRITVKTSIMELTYTRVIFHYEVFRNELQNPVTTGETMHVWTNKDIKPINLKKKCPEVYYMLQKALA